MMVDLALHTLVAIVLTPAVVAAGGLCVCLVAVAWVLVFGRVRP